MPSDEDPIAEDAYDELAGDYADDVETNPYNASLEFPATSDLVPEVAGDRVLDAGVAPATTPGGSSTKARASSAPT